MTAAAAAPTPAEALERDGFAVARGALSPDLLGGVRAEHDGVRGGLRPAPPPKDEPFALYWTHVRGAEQPRKPLRELPLLSELVYASEVTRLARAIARAPMRLYEVIVFAKPPGTSERLHWHQDESYFPVETPLMLTAWVPLYPVDRESGALNYAVGSHRHGLRGGVDLLNGSVGADDRPLVPTAPEAEGHRVVCCEMNVGDVAFHHGRTWHMSGPNVGAARHDRIAISIRYAVDPLVYRPHPANARLSSRFAHLTLRDGERIDAPCFPPIAAPGA